MATYIVIFFLLAAATFFLPISYRLKLGSVLGYLIAGIIVGPQVLGIVWNAESLTGMGELGILFLMFVIGLEIHPKRLKALRKTVFGMGGLQVALTTLLVCGLLCLFHYGWKGSLLLAMAFSLSSTALILQSLGERGELTSILGRDSFGILLFQDIAVIPIMTLIPLIGVSAAGAGGDHAAEGILPLPIALFVAIGVGIAGRFLLKHYFRRVSRYHSRELFLASALLVVIAFSLMMKILGFSMALGAFLAGVILADSEFRHELEADIEPFKGLLLGMFFMTIGMQVDLQLFAQDWMTVLGLVGLLYAVKAIPILIIGRIFGRDLRQTQRLAFYLGQGGEFAFVIISYAVASQLLTSETAKLASLVITMSMFVSPLFFALDDFIHKKFEKKEVREFDTIDESNPVVIAGFGRFGQIVGRILTTQRIPFTALEKSFEQVDFLRRFGNKIFYGDASRLDILQSAKVDRARAFILAIDDVESSVRTAEMMSKHFPQIPIYARARNRAHSFRLMDIGVKVLHRETLQSSLALTKDLLIDLGLTPENSGYVIRHFQKYDEELLIRQHAVYSDESKLIEASKQAAKDLENLFTTDQSQGPTVQGRSESFQNKPVSH